MVWRASSRQRWSAACLEPAALPLLLLLPLFVAPCVLQGTDSGVCAPITEDMKARMPFCFDLLYTEVHPGDKRMYHACLPKPVLYPHLTPQWANHTIEYKDMWVKNRYLDMMQFRKYAEWNFTAESSELTEEGESQGYPNRGKIFRRFFREMDDLQGGPQLVAPTYGPLLDTDEEFSDSEGPGTNEDPRCGPDSIGDYPCETWEPWLQVDEACCSYEPVLMYGELEPSPPLFENDCMRAYKNLLCYINFPRCSEEKETLIMCQSTCQNFFDACNYKSDMHRCGPTKYLNGNGFENPDDNPLETEGDVTRKVFRRSFMPGQPWYERPEEEVGSVIAQSLDGTLLESYVDAMTCTPSILDAGMRSAGGAPTLLMLVLVAFTAVIVF